MFRYLAFNFTFGEVKGRMRKLRGNLTIPFDYRLLMHYAGVFFFHEKHRVLQWSEGHTNVERLPLAHLPGETLYRTTRPLWSQSQDFIECCNYVRWKPAFQAIFKSF
jgi:hypothetical protein